jgi:alpha-amylase
VTDRRRETCQAKKIEAWIHFNFPGRGDQYSSMKWHWRHFSGTDWDQYNQKNAIYKIVDPPETLARPGVEENPNWRKKDWATDVSDWNGNGDYLMFSNIDYSNADVREDVEKWGDWMVSEVGVDGFRLDAVPHFSWMFTRGWIQVAMDAAKRQQRDLFIMGEYYNNDPMKIVQWMDMMGPSVYAYDLPLLGAFSRLSMAKSKYDVDLRKVYKNTLMQHRPNNSVVSLACCT